MHPKHAALVPILAALLSGLTPLLHAQQGGGDIAYVSPDLPDDPNLAKVTMLRLLYTGSPKAPTICLVREPQGQRPAIIESNLATGAISPYVAMRPSRFTLHILDGAVTEDPVKPLPLKEKKLTEPLKLALYPGTYQTLLVREQEGKITAIVIPDTRPGKNSAPVMRVLDLSGLEGWTVRLLSRKGQLVKSLWTSGTGVPTEGISLPASGIYHLQVLRAKPTGTQQVGMFEAKLTAGSPFSIVLYPGTGEGAADLAFDAAPGAFYNAEAIKALAGGGATSPVAPSQ